MDDYERRLGADKLDYSREQDAYNRLAKLIAAGYRPTAAEYAAAGMTPAQGAALRKQAKGSTRKTVIIKESKKSSGKTGASKIRAKKASGSLKKS